MPAAEPVASPPRRHGDLVAWVLTLLATLWADDLAVAESLSPEQIIATTAEAFANVVLARRVELEADLRKDQALVDEYLLPRFDLASACRLILHDHWKAATPEQRRRFVDAFYRYLLASYGDALLEFRHDTIKVFPPEYEAAGSSTRVRTQMKLTGGSVFDVVYYMRRDDSGWTIVDVIAEGVSFVRTYRSEFGMEIRADSLEALTARLEDVAARNR